MAESEDTSRGTAERKGSVFSRTPVTWSVRAKAIPLDGPYSLSFSI